ncbi:hypothetical protein [Azoarcus sp. KH32C]|uniref:hypothetical protein n=1 Tax=Azoarcus sp. KH32C TaxID=748247 RepID=UPI000238688D|nr:hypothetical protein [Azoarcus sp. KH32C]BAL25885.1 hypothetical protein AZKH_3600 [Azoarcus sp. KH32C]
MSAPIHSWGSYLRWTLATLVLVVASAGAINVAIDPQGVFDSPRVAGLNAVKPYLDHHRELARWQAARRVCASAGIFGNSRAEIGFDPENEGFARRGLSAFNHAVPGTSAELSLRQINWLDAAGCMPKTVVLGVEFFDFLGGARPRPLAARPTEPAPRPDLRFLAESVFSVSGLRDSLDTMLLQHASYPATLTPRGFNPLLNYIPEVAQNGHYVLFRQRAEENVRSWLRKPRRLQPVEGGASENEQVLDAILARSARAAATTYLVIYPYHAEIRMMLERLGMGELFAEWKKSIVAIAARHAAAGGRVEVWDFSGIAPETLESIPARGDRRTRMQYYWEAGHFKKALGDRVLARLLGDENGFGVRLDSSNADRWIAEDRARVQALLAEPSPLLAEVDAVLERYASR